MNLLPFENLTIQSPLSPQDALQKLSEVIEPKKFLRLSYNRDKPYEGKIGEHDFTINRIIHYRNSFLPVIHGEVQSAPIGSIIQLRIRPYTVSTIFMFLWLGIIGIVLLVVIASQLSALLQGVVPESDFWLILLVLAFMLLAGYGGSMVGFIVEANKAKAYLRELFQEQPAPFMGNIEPK